MSCVQFLLHTYFMHSLWKLHLFIIVGEDKIKFFIVQFILNDLYLLLCKKHWSFSFWLGGQGFALNVAEL